MKIKNTLPPDISSDHEVLAATALELTRNLNFEKACRIICEGISDRMPLILEKVEGLEGLSESDKNQFKEFSELSRHEVINKTRAKIYSKRDSIVNSYHEIFAKLDEKTVDPEFSKTQAKRTVYKNILQNRDHFLTLRQFPYDWNNEELFGTLWGYSILAGEWSENVDASVQAIIESTKGKPDSMTGIYRLDKYISWVKNHKILSIGALGLMALIWFADLSDALVKLGILKDNATEIQREEFFNNNPPQFDLWYSAFSPANRDPILIGTLLDDTTKVTGSYRLVNKGRAVVTVKEFELPSILRIRGYFTDRIVALPFNLSPGDTIVVSCEMLQRKPPITEMENVLKEDIRIICLYLAADIQFTYKFQWKEGLFRKERVERSQK